MDTKKISKYFDKDRTVMESVIYTLLLALLQAGLSIPFAKTFYSAWNEAALAIMGKGLPQIEFTTTGYVFMFLALYLAFLTLILISTLFVHAYLWLFGASKAPFRHTVSSICYGLTPTYLLGWIPYVSVASYPISLAAIIFGLSRRHQLPRWKFSMLIIALLLLLASAALYLMGY